MLDLLNILNKYLVVIQYIQSIDLALFGGLGPSVYLASEEKTKATNIFSCK